MEDRRIITGRPSGIVTPPPSKSYSHRAVICAFLASLISGEKSVIENLGGSQDIEATLRGIKMLGGRFRLDGATLTMEAAGKPLADTIDCGESGSTLRFLIPVAALLNGGACFTGSERLLARPLHVYEQVFGEAGALFQQEGGRVLVHGPLRSGDYRIPGDVSSQFVSGLLFALPTLPGDSTLSFATPLESKAYVDMTIDVMRQFSIEIKSIPGGYEIPGGQRYRPARYTVEADYSQAAFFLAAAALGCDVKAKGLSEKSLQGDKAILEILRGMGAVIRREGDIVSVTAGTLCALTVDAREIPDLIPPVAALCCFCEGTSRIIGAGRLRLKESDRLHALAVELGNLGASVRELDDALEIDGVGAAMLPGGRVQSHNDHRIAMAMALASLRCEGAVELSGGDSVAKSYPDFWRDFCGGSAENKEAAI